MPGSEVGVKKPSGELRLRILSALVLAAVALTAAAWGGAPFAAFWLAAGIVTFLEWSSVSGLARRSGVNALFGGALAALTGAHLFETGPWLLTAAILALAGTIVARGWRDRAWALSGFAYASALVVVPPLVRDDPRFGLAGLLWMFAVVWATDIAAYFTGRALGGPKLWPRVSPKKTWSGFCGGLVAAVLAGLAVTYGAVAAGVASPLGYGGSAVLAGVASILSQGGDLGESAFKRHFDVKDSGHLIPGHGGVMDRIDGFCAVCVLVGLLLAGMGGVGS